MEDKNKFWELVTVDWKSGCWDWNGRTDKLGYGYFNLGSKRHRAHRWSYEFFKAPIPEGLVIDHLCGNASCVNPAHLECVTAPENNIRRGLVYADRRRCLECNSPLKKGQRSDKVYCDGKCRNKAHYNKMRQAG